MSSEDPIIEGRLLSSLKVTELREQLEKNGLPSKGNKAVLQDRLKEFLAGGQKPVVKQESPLVAEYRAKQQKALAEARAADPRNKKVEEEQVTSTKEQVTPTKQPEEPAETKVVEKVAEVEVKIDEPVVPEIKPEVAQKNEEEADKSSSSSSSSSSSTGSSSSSRASTPEAKEEEKKETEVKPKSASPEVEEPKRKSPTPEVKEEKVEEKKEAEPEKMEVESAASEEIEKKDDDNGTKEKEILEDKSKDNEDNGDELDYGDEDETAAKEEPINDENDDDEKKKKDVEKKEKVREVTSRRATSPSSRHPLSDIVHIRGLVRPFTENNLRAVISLHGGEIVDFWIDKVKSHCFAKMTSSENAAKILSAMHDTHWPESNPKLLSVVHDTEDNMNRYKEGRGEAKLPEIVTVGTLTGASRADRISTTSNSSVVVSGKSNLRITVENAVRDNSKRDNEVKERKSLASRLTRIDKSAITASGDAATSSSASASTSAADHRKRQRSETPPFSKVVEEKRNRLDGDRLRRPSEPTLKTPDDLFRKTKTLPALYYVPLTDEQVAKKERKTVRPSDRNRSRRHD